MRKVSVRPRSTQDSPSSIDERDLIRAFANVLAWANLQNVVSVSFTPNELQYFSFTYADGVVSHDCENVSEPPSDLGPLILESALWAISSNRIAFWINRFRMRYLGYVAKAELEVLVTEGNSSWMLELAWNSLIAHLIS